MALLALFVLIGTGRAAPAAETPSPYRCSGTATPGAEAQCTFLAGGHVLSWGTELQGSGPVAGVVHIELKSTVPHVYDECAAAGNGWGGCGGVAFSSGPGYFMPLAETVLVCRADVVAGSGPFGCSSS
jgi:hypothetical protein